MISDAFYKNIELYASYDVLFLAQLRIGKNATKSTLR